MKRQSHYNYPVRDQGHRLFTIGVTAQPTTSHGRLIFIQHLLRTLKLAHRANRRFPKPGSNRGYAPGQLITTFLLMAAGGAARLCDVNILHREQRRLALGGLHRIPSEHSLSHWLRQHGTAALQPLQMLSRWLIGIVLKPHRIHRHLTLDIDASLFHCKKKSATRTYQGKRGYAPMIGILAETGQAVGLQFRTGNTAPAYDNLGFIQHCEQGLPDGYQFTRVRIDAAGDQRDIIEYCQEHQLGFVIRADLNERTKEMVQSVKPDEWQPLKHADGSYSTTESVAHKIHIMSDSEVPFILVIQRQKIDNNKKKNKKGAKKPSAGQDATVFQPCLPGFERQTEEVLDDGEYLDRALATNRLEMSDSRTVQCYNERGDRAENMIRNLKHDGHARHLPCSDFGGNAAYLGLCALAHHLFIVAQMTVLPPAFRFSRAPTVRDALIRVRGQFARHARRHWVNVSHHHQQQLQDIMAAIDRLGRWAPMLA